MEIFFKFPEKNFHLRELSRMVKLSLPAIKKITSRLEKEKLLILKKEKMFINVYASRNEKFVWLKRSYNLNSLFDLTNYLNNFYEEPEAIVLFGSYSKGEDISKSDVDIAIITNSKKEIDLSKFEKKLARHINLMEIDLKKTEKQFKNSLANGVVLNGGLRIV
jgi:predicted nucleotidyltransferase